MHDQDSLLVAPADDRQRHQREAAVPGLGPQLARSARRWANIPEALLCSTYWDENVPYKDKFSRRSRRSSSSTTTAKFTRPIAYHTAGAAACIETYILAMQAAKSIKAEAVRDALAVADYETFYSRIKFTPDGDGDAIIMGAHDRPGA